MPLWVSRKLYFAAAPPTPGRPTRSCCAGRQSGISADVSRCPPACGPPGRRISVGHSRWLIRTNVGNGPSCLLPRPFRLKRAPPTYPLALRFPPVPGRTDEKRTKLAACAHKTPAAHYPAPPSGGSTPMTPIYDFPPSAVSCPNRSCLRSFPSGSSRSKPCCGGPAVAPSLPNPSGALEIGAPRFGVCRFSPCPFTQIDSTGDSPRSPARAPPARGGAGAARFFAPWPCGASDSRQPPTPRK